VTAERPGVPDSVERDAVGCRWPHDVVRRAPLWDIDAEIGFAFTARTGHPELSSHARPSAAVLLEDGQPLAGPGNALHDDIRKSGGGRFSFWYDYVYFSTSDDSDPRTNGRRYEIEYSVTPLQDVLSRLSNRLRAVRPPDVSAVARNYAADRQLDMWRRIGFTPARETSMLDFGCGGGERVDEFRRRGYQAFGCDVLLPARPVGALQEHMTAAVIRPIELKPYRIPFDDGSFDLVFSITVFEHVLDYDSALAEIRRVLKPGGLAVHVFPPPWKFLETHVFVPYASVFRPYWWLYLWALLGVRNRFQRGYSARRTADVNSAFLKNETNYLPKRRIREHVLRHFEECQFLEEAAFSRRRYAFFQRAPRLLPLYRNWFSETRGRVLVCRRKRNPL
jgi:SAM-dependent methyltransferase